MRLVIIDYGSGNFTIKEILSYAIDYAENGHAINKSSAFGFDFYKHLFLEDKGSTDIFIKDYSLEMRQLQEDVLNGTIPQEEYINKMRLLKQWDEGDIIVQKDLAETLKRIASDGRDGFYKGQTADLIVNEMKANNGLISHNDLKEYNSVYREPIVGSYRGYTIISMGPPSSGGPLIIQMLNMLENFEIASMKRPNVIVPSVRILTPKFSIKMLVLVTSLRPVPVILPSIFKSPSDIESEISKP